MIDIVTVDHIGIRVADLQRACGFYAALGFELVHESDFDTVAILRNPHGVEINLIINANDANDDRNILLDVVPKYPGYTHVALRVASMRQTIESLHQHGIAISQGPVTFGDDGGASVFVRDPDRNVIELRGRGENLSALEGVTLYQP